MLSSRFWIEKRHPRSEIVTLRPSCEELFVDAQTLNSFAQELRRRRADMIARVAQTQEELDYLSADRESEWSDRALEERTMHLLSRLDVRETEAVRELDAALER